MKRERTTEALAPTHRLRRPRRPRAPLGWVLLAMVVGTPVLGQEAVGAIDLTLERMVELTLSNSYEVRFLNMGVEQTRLRLSAERAALRSSVSLDLAVPTFQSLSEFQYDSEIGRNVVVHENSRLWEAELSVRQPVILPFLGYPTNGYLSLNNRVYRYTQLETDGERDLTYYNRYFIRYTQPLFQPNRLKNNLEEAELDLEGAEIDFYADAMEIVGDVSQDWLELFESAYRQTIYQRYVANLVLAQDAALGSVNADVDASRALGADQIAVELANAREQVQSAQSRFRLETSRLKTQLGIPDSVVIELDPVIDVRPVLADVERATQFARDLTPRLRQLDISRRESEIDLDETRGENGFELDLEFTYGREMQDPRFRALWGEPSNTYTVDVNASVPIWDWGERRARIEAQQISVQRTLLRIEQAEAQIASDVLNEVRNVEELQARALAMQENVALAASISSQSLQQFREGTISALDLMQSLRRETDTANNLLDAFTGWRRALQELQELTYYDFEYDQPVLQRFGVTGSTGEIILGPG